MECLRTPYVVFPWHPRCGRSSPTNTYVRAKLQTRACIYTKSRMQRSVRADRSRLHRRVPASTQMLVFNPLGNFKIDATMRPSHGRSRGHFPSIRPSIIVRVTTLAMPYLIHHREFPLPPGSSLDSLPMLVNDGFLRPVPSLSSASHSPTTSTVYCRPLALSCLLA